MDHSVTWQGPFATIESIDEAFRRASDCCSIWSTMQLEQRCDKAILYANYLKEHAQEIALAITLESGKPLWESSEEVQSSIAKVSNAIQAIRSRRWIAGEPGPERSRPHAVRYHPLGVMLVLGPYNLPLHLPGAHMVPVLLAGNTVVFKPSEKAPAVGEWIRKAWQAAELPAGTVEVIHGSAEQAKHAINNDKVAGVLFTGSYRAGIEIHRQLAGRPEVLLALEMGGNNPVVVDRVHDHSAAIAAIIQSAYITSGQRCTCARRIIIVDYPENRGLIEDLSQAIQSIRVSQPLSVPQPFMGTLVSEPAAQAILQVQEDWIGNGAKVWNRCVADSKYPAQLTPGLIQVDEIQVADEEHFGPLATVQMASSFELAVNLANQTKYGLAASLLSDDESRFEYFVGRVRAGIINWNAPTTGASGSLPFGGLGSSGNHRPSGYFACDYASDPIASVQKQKLTRPENLPIGLESI